MNYTARYSCYTWKFVTMSTVMTQATVRCHSWLLKSFEAEAGSSSQAPPCPSASFVARGWHHACWLRALSPCHPLKRQRGWKLAVSVPAWIRPGPVAFSATDYIHASLPDWYFWNTHILLIKNTTAQPWHTLSVYFIIVSFPGALPTDSYTIDRSALTCGMVCLFFWNGGVPWAKKCGKYQQWTVALFLELELSFWPCAMED